MEIRQHIINTGKLIYSKTPSRSLRKLYYHIFCTMVRGLKVQTSVDGINYKLDLGESIDLSLYLNRYEPDITAAIEKHCRPGMTVLDIGANIGAHTLRFAKIVGESGRVFAFEPTNYAYKKLQRNISLNSFGNIFTFRLALFNKNYEKQTVSYRSSWRTDGQHIDTPIVVDFRRLDDWCADNNIEHVDLIKIDVDGNEFPILDGGLELLKKSCPLIFIEAVGPHFDDDDKNPFVVLKKLDYRFQDAQSGKEYVNLLDIKFLFPENDIKLTKSINIIALPPTFHNTL